MSTNMPQDSFESRDQQVLNFYMEKAEDVLAGKLIFASMYEPLERSIAKCTRSGEEVPPHAIELLKALPAAEITNMLKKIEGLIAEGETQYAKMWHADAAQKLLYWQKSGNIDEGLTAQLQSTLNACRNALYPDTPLQQNINIAIEQIREDMADMAKFHDIDKDFLELEANDQELTYKVGDPVKFKKEEYDDSVVYWTVVRAEKGHYLLERKNGETGKYVHCMVSEKDLKETNII